MNNHAINLDLSPDLSVSIDGLHSLFSVLDDDLRHGRYISIDELRYLTSLTLRTLVQVRHSLDGG